MGSPMGESVRVVPTRVLLNLADGVAKGEFVSIFVGIFSNRRKHRLLAEGGDDQGD